MRCFRSAAIAQELCVFSRKCPGESMDRMRPLSAMPPMAAAHVSSETSKRVEATDHPVIVKTKRLMAGATDVISLAQGVVHWPPPDSALQAAASALAQPAVNAYGPCDGLPELVSALEAKVEVENDLPEHKIMVTAGANQAFVNIVLTLLDPADTVVLFVPYYFNHLMAIQMTGGAESVIRGQCDPQTFHPDLDWLEERLQGNAPPRMVVLVNPCNPTGVLLTRQELERAAELCEKAGSWLVVSASPASIPMGCLLLDGIDNTYEHMVYEGRQHVCPSGNHVLHIFSFSKAFGMMGWRMGYIAYKDPGGRLSEQLQKVQDTIPICPPQLSMHVALAATREGRPWVARRLESLLENRKLLIDALSPLGTLGDGIAGGEGAIYLWARLPKDCSDDDAVVAWLVQEYGVCVIPGTSCGAPGYIRVAFGNLKPELCREAAGRLKSGLQALAASGIGDRAHSEAGHAVL